MLLACWPVLVPVYLLEGLNKLWTIIILQMRKTVVFLTQFLGSNILYLHI